MSASISPTAAPRARRASARLAATVDLPTPPLPLATAITCRMPGSDTFDCGPGPWPCMRGISLGNRLAQFAQVLDGVDAGVVSVVPDNFVGVITDGAHRGGPRRSGLQLPWRQDAERVRWLLPVLPAGRTRARGAEGVPGNGPFLAVAPFDVEAV